MRLVAMADTHSCSSTRCDKSGGCSNCDLEPEKKHNARTYRGGIERNLYLILEHTTRSVVKRSCLMDLSVCPTS